MTLTLFVGFYEPLSRIWVDGERDFWVDDEKDAKDLEKRYAAYFKETYGEGTEVFRLELKKD